MKVLEEDGKRKKMEARPWLDLTEFDPWIKEEEGRGRTGGTSKRKEGNELSNRWAIWGWNFMKFTNSSLTLVLGKMMEFDGLRGITSRRAKNEKFGKWRDLSDEPKISENEFFGKTLSIFPKLQTNPLPCSKALLFAWNLANTFLTLKHTHSPTHYSK